MAAAVIFRQPLFLCPELLHYLLEFTKKVDNIRKNW